MSHTQLSRRPPHPLFGAELRVRRAGIHIRSLKRRIRTWAESHWEHIEWEIDEHGNNVDWSLNPAINMNLLGEAGVWIGETLYSLRSALDYLVYETACVNNGGRHVPGTQFPIEDHRGTFIGRFSGVNPYNKKAVKQYLRCVPAGAIARIAKLQPCAHPPCEWTKLLRELSNPDKHWHLASLTSEARFLPSDHEELVGLVDEGPRERHYLVVQVFFTEPRLDVIDTLELLHREVRAVVQEFKPAFKRAV